MGSISDNIKNPPGRNLFSTLGHSRQMTDCLICSQLKDIEVGFQKYGREDEDTFLPEAMSGLKFVRDIKPGLTRTPELLQCPECGTFYVYKVEYEYLAAGSEDEQRLTRVKSEHEAENLY
jgi:hypothetical protein